MEKIACSASHNRISYSKASVNNIMSGLDPVEVPRATKAFRGRVEAVPKANGIHVEEMYRQ